MIYSLDGTLTYFDQNFAVVSCGGVGFKCFTTLTTLQSLPGVGKPVQLFTYLSVREDALDLYGFATTAELDCFKLLISVNGVGPKAALAILSELSADRLAVCIAGGDAKSLTRAPGIGKKIAERIVLELKDKMGVLDLGSSSEVQAAAAANRFRRLCCGRGGGSAGGSGLRSKRCRCGCGSDGTRPVGGRDDPPGAAPAGRQFVSLKQIRSCLWKIWTWKIVLCLPA